ncbi:hypothetical protein SAMD00023353_0201820 [Rosellinia necatrix]|uniref:Uncharacterized protein n=1 Tax=Rosellinia necatrix TaxID=77044 RepID=A0A1S8A4W8_ROSNE|nr:hypothetical protein SAMD00023353_0201820 [Rosellinia necatrix]
MGESNEPTGGVGGTKRSVQQGSRQAAQAGYKTENRGWGQSKGGGGGGGGGNTKIDGLWVVEDHWAVS